MNTTCDPGTMNLPFVPELDHARQKLIALRPTPRDGTTFAQQIVLGVRAHELASIGVLDPVDAVYETVDIAAVKLVVRNIIKQTLQVIRRRNPPAMISRSTNVPRRFFSTRIIGFSHSPLP